MCRTINTLLWTKIVSKNVHLEYYCVLSSSFSRFLVFFLFWPFGICSSLKYINTKQLIVSTFSCASNGSCQQSECQQQTQKRHLIHWSKSRVLSIITKQDNAANRYPCYRRWCWIYSSFQTDNNKSGYF